MLDIVLSLGSTIAKVLLKLWLGKTDDIADLASCDIIDLIKTTSLNKLETRKLARDFETIGDKISDSLCELVNDSDLDSSQIESISNEVFHVVNSTNITHKMLLDLSNNPIKLYEKLISHSIEVKKGVSVEETQLFKKCLKSIAQYIIDIAPNFPNYTRENFHEIIDRFNIVVDKIDKLLDETRLIESSTNDKKVHNFEVEYKNAIIRKYRTIDLFDANISRDIRRYELGIAYIDLEAECIGNTAEGRMKASDIFDVIQEVNAICIIGEAGSGKTTFLQWLAVKFASASSEKFVPFFIELRKINTWPNIDLEQFVSTIIKDTICEIPNGWLGNVLVSGKALFLIDGLDEIGKSEREIVYNWLDELDQDYVYKLILTTRPSAKENYMDNFYEVELLPMNEKKVWQFIQYWHKAVLFEPCLENEDTIKIIESKLINKIKINEAILKLATNPLLCAMICALHYQNNLLLPTDKDELYEECCKMLLESRDKIRNIKTCRFSSLSYKNKRAILDDLAYWMIRNGKAAAEIEDVKGHISKKVVNMNIIKNETEVNELLEYFIERSGLIREPEIGVIDFIHKTFQEYMAAEEIRNQGDWGLLIENADKDSWRETIILAVNNANRKIADNIITMLIEKGEKDHQKRIKYHTLAMACNASAIEVSETVRKKIEKITKQLIPPTSASECIEIANSGNYVIPYLGNKNFYSSEQKNFCIRTLKYIGTRNILRVIKTYFDDNLNQTELTGIEQVLSDYSLNDIALYGVGDRILQYVSSHIKNRELSTDEILLTAIKKVKNFSNKCKAFNELSFLKINNYNGNNIDYLNLLSIKGVSVKGKFKTIPILNSIQNLQELSISSENPEFDIYSIIQYKSLTSIREFYYSTSSTAYLDFGKLNFLDNVCLLNLEFVEELECDWSSLTYLKNLTILQLAIHNNDWEECFDGISHLKALKELSLIIQSSNIPKFTPDFIYADQLQNIHIISDSDNEAINDFVSKLNLSMPSCKITCKNAIISKELLK